MRTSVLSRSVVAIAALGVASAAFAAPANAADSATGITRDQVINAANAVRIDGVLDDPTDMSAHTSRAVRVLANRACKIDRDREAVLYMVAGASPAGEAADAVFVVAVVANLDTILTDPSGAGMTSCTFGVVAPTKDSATLSGKATFNANTVSTSPMSGDVHVTKALRNPSDDAGLTTWNIAASGAATTTTKSTSTTTVKTPKTTAQKKAAKTKYNKAVASAKKSYKKALKKAGTSKSKKAAAKKAYNKKLSSAKAKYTLAIATKRTVTTTKVTKSPQAFAISAAFPNPGV